MPICKQSWEVVLHDTVKRRELTTGVQLSVLTMLQIAVVFGVQWYVVARLGAGAQTDALYAGLTVPQIVIVLGIESLVFVLVPFLAKRTDDQMEADVGQLLEVLGLLATAFAAIAFVAAPWFVPLLVPGFSNSGKALTVQLTRIQSVGLIGAVWSSVLTSFYQARNKFILPATAVLLSYVVGWLALFAGLTKFGVELAAWVQVFMLTGPALILIWGVKWKRHTQYDRDIFKQLWRGTCPIVLSSSYGRVGVILDRILASFLMPGSLVAFDLAQRTNGAVSRILTQGLVTPIVPAMARLVQAGEWHSFHNLYRSKALQVVMISVLLLSCALGGAYIAHSPALARWGNNSAVKSLESVWRAALFMSGVLLCASLNHTVTSAFYAMGNTVTPNKIAVFCYSMGLIFKVIGFYLAGVNGMALALSFQYMLNSLVLVQYMRESCVNQQKPTVQEVFSSPSA